MLNIDGLVTGIDTTSVIDGLMKIRQQQIDQQLAKKADVVGRQTAFSGIEARLFSLRGSLSRLTSIATTAVNDKLVTSSDESLLTAVASDKAATGVYRMRVQQVATAHQVASTAFSSPESEITTGDFSLRVGNSSITTLTIDETNNSAQGLVDAINASDADVTATIINNGSTGGNSYQVLLTSNRTGQENQLALTNGLAASTGTAFQPTFDLDNPVEAGSDAIVSFGSGTGAITVQSGTNQIDNLIAGVTLNVHASDNDTEIILNVAQDVESARTAVENFVSSYNGVISYINDQVRFNTESSQAGPLLGERSVTTIQNELQQTINTVIGGVNSQANRLSTIGISFSSSGTLELNSSKLDDALAGRTDGVAADDVARLFAISGTSSNGGIRFVAANSRTQEGTVEIDITSPAEKATIVATTALAPSITIDSSNNQVSLDLDGKASSNLTLTEGVYTPAELAAELETAINGDTELAHRGVTVSLDNGALRITSATVGSTSKLELVSGSAAASLGFSGTESDIGQDVVGRFLVDGQVEAATGSGNLLIGDSDNPFTADLQVRVTLSSTQIQSGTDGTLTVARGLAARLDDLLGNYLDVVDGRVKTVNDRYDDILEGIQETIDRMNIRFDAEQESLLRQFAALETAVSELQTAGSFLSSLLPTK